MTDIPNSRRSPMEHERDMPDAQTDAPERIWAFPPTGFEELDTWQPTPHESATAYVRSDLHDAAQAEIAKLRASLAGYVVAFDDVNHPKNEEGANEYYGALLDAHVKARAALSRDASE